MSDGILIAGEDAEKAIKALDRLADAESALREIDGGIES